MSILTILLTIILIVLYTYTCPTFQKGNARWQICSQARIKCRHQRPKATVATSSKSVCTRQRSGSGRSCPQRPSHHTIRGIRQTPNPLIRPAICNVARRVFHVYWGRAPILRHLRYRGILWEHPVIHKIIGENIKVSKHSLLTASTSCYNRRKYEKCLTL